MLSAARVPALLLRGAASSASSSSSFSFSAAAAACLLQQATQGVGVGVGVGRGRGVVARGYASVDREEAHARVRRLQQAKKDSGKTYDDLATELGLTNTYTAQLLLGQAQLKEGTVDKFKAALPNVSEEDVRAMMECPMRGFDSEILKDPQVYRTYEAVTHYGEAIKAIMNEQCGDGIMSAIDFYMTVDTVVGKQGEKRVVLTFNGKFLPFVEQQADDNTAARD